MERSSRVSKMAHFRDDLISASKVFVRLNSYRKLNGFRKIEWNEILCELAVARSHQLVRSRAGIVHLLQIGGAKFNLGVSYVDVSTYGPIEEKDRNQVPLHRMIENAWASYPRFSEAVLDPLARFGAISVYKSEKAVCTTIFITIMLPNSFSPRRLKGGEERKKKHKKKKTKKGKKHGENCGDIAITSGTDTDSQDEKGALLEAGEITPLTTIEMTEDSNMRPVDMMEVVGEEKDEKAAFLDSGEMNLMKPGIQEFPVTSDRTETAFTVLPDLEEEIREAAARTWTGGQYRTPGFTSQ